MTNRNLDIMPDLGPEWTRDTCVETPCFDTRDAEYWVLVEEGGITLDGAALEGFIIEAPDWPGLRAAAFEWLRTNNLDMCHWVYNLPQVMISTGDLLNEVVAVHSGVSTKAAAAKLKEWDVTCSVWNPSFQVTEHVSGNDQEVAIDKALALVNANHSGAVVHITHVTEVPTPVTEPPPISREKQIEVALRAFVDAADATRFIPYNKVAPLIKSAEEALRGTS
jgi:hypothetical protein